MKFTKQLREELSKNFDISLATFYNWEKTKPRLIELIKLGLQKEKELLEETEEIEKSMRIAEDVYPIILKMKEDIERLGKEIELSKEIKK